MHRSLHRFKKGIQYCEPSCLQHLNLNKLTEPGITDKALNVIESYLTNRITKIEYYESQPAKIM